MTEQHYGTLDRQPARGSGIASAFLWCLGALVVALAMSFAAEILFYDVLDAAIDPFTGGSVVPEPVALVGSGLLVGGSIGLVIGSRVHRARIWVAVGVTVFYLAFIPFPLLGFYGVGPFWATVGIVSLLAAAALVAWLFARRGGRRVESPL